METVYLSLGSNLGDRFTNISRATEMLWKDEPILASINASSMYETEPWGAQGQPWFLNTVVTGRTELTPEDLLRATQKIEEALGRDRGKGPARTIDIDILFYGSKVIQTQNLTIPYPNIEARHFVLTPLAELAPKFLHPVLKKTVWELLSECKDTLIIRPFNE